MQEVLPLPPPLEAEFLQRHHPLTDFNLALKGAGSVTPTLGSQLIGCQSFALWFGGYLAHTASCFLRPAAGAGVRGLCWNGWSFARSSDLASKEPLAVGLEATRGRSSI